VQDRTRVIMND